MTQQMELKNGEGDKGVRPEFAVKHYSVQELAELWGLARTTVARIFANEPGVLFIGTGESKLASRRRAPRRTMRIPEPVAARVHAKLERTA